MNKHKNTQKGRIPLMKIRYKKEGEIGLYSNKGFRMNDIFLKSLPSQKILPINVGKKYNRYKREGIRLGRGKSKIAGREFKIYKEQKLGSISIIKTNILSSYIKTKKKEKEMDKMVKKIIKRYPYIRIRTSLLKK